ncbi:MAG: DoxX family protein [Pseudomonadota bacterium]
MTALLSLTQAFGDRLEREDWLLPTLARFLFAAVLLVYFMKAGLTKLGDGFAGLWTPSLGAYAQIFPKAMEAAGYDVTALGTYHKIVVLAGTWAELILPVLIVLGLFTRLAALGMIVFVIVQSLTDVFGLGLSAELGGWFDGAPGALILDQRGLWVLLFAVLVFKGAGPLSIDQALRVKRD